MECASLGGTVASATGGDDDVAVGDSPEAPRARFTCGGPDVRVSPSGERLASVLHSTGRGGHVFIVPRDVDSQSVEVWRLSLDRKKPSLSRPSAGIKCERASICVDRATSFVVRGRTSDGLDFRVVVAVDGDGAVVGWLCRSPRRTPCIYPRACLVCVRA